MSFVIKQDDTRPTWLGTLLKNYQTPSETEVNLTTATSAKFIMRKQGELTPKINTTMDITDAASGEVEYVWVDGDTDELGTFDVEVEVTWNDGGIETFPNSGYLTVIVTDDLG